MKIRFHNIDLLRFVFAVAMVVGHVSGMKGFSEIDNFRESLTNTTAVVECFFILAGFFLQRSLLLKGVSFIEFLRGKIARLWPTMFVSLFVLYLMGRMSGSQLIMNSCFLQCIGYTAQFKGTLWFISPLFWCLLFYYGLFHAVRDSRRRNLIISVIVYVSYLLCMTGAHGGFSRNFAFSFVPMSVCRALGGIGLGILVNEFFNCMTERNLSLGNIRYIIYSVVEFILVCAFFINVFVKQWAAHPLFVIVMLMTAILIMFALNIGYLSRLIDNPKVAYPGRYAYSIYVMQPVGITILEKMTPWMKSYMGEGTIVFIYSIVVIVLGIISYYVIELPGNMLVKKFFYGMPGENVRKGD